jgi:hypothetical protein
MDITQIPCTHCGVVNEVIERRAYDDYNPLCLNCGKAVRAHRKIEFVGGQGGLFLQHIPRKGLGVFSQQAFIEGTLVERCPAYLISVPGLEAKAVLMQMHLLPHADTVRGAAAMHMVLPWMAAQSPALALGYGMLYNHAPLRQSNLLYRAYVDPDTNRRYFDFTAKKDIEAYTELTQTYNSPSNLWFSHKAGS